ncbi:MAG: hypothetical protein AWT59_1712 [Candidatus Gallionella acididurans]|uniref:DUF4382 domain-containing protein n=1 Tax=Candidatus Gallionella acididurans TaxID=1796491 RepID=A0A139BT91_9PROT|nr:MAG: hypothetical protein AWT59_1712 [Candidatus Gallionella acididurans]
MNNLSIKSLLLLGVGLLSAVLLLACSGGSGAASLGTLALQLTDSAACGYDHVYVTVDHVDISSNNGSNWTSIPVTPGTGQIDLLTLTNGKTLPLAYAILSAGTYNQMRLVLVSNSTTPNANSVVLTGSSSVIPLTTPSAQQSGFKLNLQGPITVKAGTQDSEVMDFNACKSIVVAGNSGQYILKPVVTATAVAVAGSITGTITGGAGAMVYAEYPGTSTTAPVIINGTVADTNGNFTLYPVPTSSVGGNVDVVIAAAQPAPPATTSVPLIPTYIVQNVVVTGVNSLGTIAPATSSMNTVSGTVSQGANLVADQTVTSSGRVYEITATMTSAASPYVFSFSLAATGPQVALYSTTSPLTFTADTADAGNYTIIATDANGGTGSQTVIGAASGVIFTLNP